MRRVKDSTKSKEDILKAAEQKFSEKGLYGTRVDEIAAAAKINKRMIYEYFGSKEELYKAVLCEVYGRLGYREQMLLAEELPCVQAVRAVVTLYFDFLRDNPTYVSLILWENLNKGEYIDDLDFSNIKQPALVALRNLIERGKKEGVFKEKIDTEQIILMLLTSSFASFSNRYTLSKLLGYDLSSYDSIEKRAVNLADMLLTYMRK